jgi:hypothetical protein
MCRKSGFCKAVRNFIFEWSLWSNEVIFGLNLAINLADAGTAYVI